MATHSKAPAPSTNGVLSAPPPVGVNRKKAKRRAKQQAKSAQQLPVHHVAGQQTTEGYDEDALRYEEEEEDDYDSEADYDPSDDHHYAPHAPTNGVHPPPPPLVSSGSKRGKKKQTGSMSQGGAYDPRMLPPSMHHGENTPSSGPVSLSRPHRGSRQGDAIWHTSMQQERENIKHFWLNLTEDERKRLLRIEKEAVLKKMKQQQKHSCSCTVCGRKRLAIEDELELLYEGYYAELEQYAHHDVPPLPSSDGLVPDPLQHRRPHPLATPPPPLHHPHHAHAHTHSHHRTSQIHEVLDDEDEYSEEEEDEEEYSDEEEDEDYSDDEPEPEPEPPRGHPGVPDFFNFGTHLTVKGIHSLRGESLQAELIGEIDNLLTVADDLLKNDGRKFIEMMEQLAERRLQREQRSQYESDTHSGYPPGDPTYDHQDQMDGDEFDDEEDSYNSQEEYDDDIEEEEDLVGDMKMASPLQHQTDHEQGVLTEEHRMQEGRRMFQIFAARMFEQRVLTAYKEKVAAERQQKLLDELEDDAKLQAQREAKKQRDAQKKKDKKKQQQMAKAEEKAKRDAEKAEEEAKLRAAEEKKQEEQRRRKEEQRRKREEEKKKLEEEKARKEAEKLKRQQDEQQRREETERKAREQKAAEKAKKEEQRKREREEREAREKEARERKAQDERDRKEREAKARADKDARDRERGAQQTANANHMAHPPPALAKRPSQQATVAIPGMFGKQTPSGVASPHPSVPMPAIPKASTPSKPKQASHQGSHASSPRQAQPQVPNAPSKASSPGSNGTQQAQNQPRQILQKSGAHQGNHQTQPHAGGPSPLHHQPIQPPPGMPHPQQFPPGAFGGMPPMGFQNFQGPRGPMGMPNMGQRGPMPMFPQQPPHNMGFPNGLGFGTPGMNGMGPPPGMMMPPQGRPFPFDNGPGIMGQPPPGFGQHPSHHPNHSSPVGQPPTSGIEAQRQSMSGHSRQPSSDKDRLDSAASQPIARPAPIQRPGSVRPSGPDRNGSNGDVDDLSKHLGSSALLDDSDEPCPKDRRHSSMATNPRGINIPGAGMTPMGGGFGGLNAPGTSWGNPSATPFGQSPALGGPGWGALPHQVGSWGANNAAFSNNNNHFGTFGAPISGPRGGPQTRPITVRQLLCNACRELSRSGEEYHNVDAVIQLIMSRNPPLDFAPDAAEVKDISTVEGDSRNGGGELHFREHDDGSKDIKWTQDASTPDQGGHRSSELAAIGSPAVGKSSPAFGMFGAPGTGRGSAGPPMGILQNLGAIGSSGL